MRTLGNNGNIIIIASGRYDRRTIVGQKINIELGSFGKTVNSVSSGKQSVDKTTLLCNANIVTAVLTNIAIPCEGIDFARRNGPSNSSRK